MVELLAARVAHRAEVARRATADAQRRHDERVRRHPVGGVVLEVLERLLAADPQRPLVREPGLERLHVDGAQLTLEAEVRVQLVGALEIAALPVVEQDDHLVGVDLRQRRVGDRAQHLVEGQAGRDGLAHLVERQRLLQAQVLRL